MNIQIITKRPEEKNMSEVTKEYKKRLSGYYNLKIVEKADSQKAYKIFVNAKNKYITSEDLAKKLSDIMIDGNSDIAFFTGEKPDNTDYDFTLTSLEVSEDMKLCMLLEQIYRAFKINNNEAYHK